MMAKKLFIGLFLFITAHSLAQELEYSIWQNGKKVGDAFVCKYETGQITTYEVLISMKATLLFSVDFSQTVVANYKSGELLLATVENYVNNNLHSSTFITKKKDHYNILRDGEELTTLKTIVSFSGIMLYFKEPLDVTKVFSEAYGVYNPVEKTGVNTYKLTNQKGQVNQYTYTNGKLKEAVINTKLITLTLKQKTKTP